MRQLLLIAFFLCFYSLSIFGQSITYSVGGNEPIPFELYTYTFSTTQSTANCTYSWFSTGDYSVFTPDGAAAGSFIEKNVYIRYTNSAVNSTERNLSVAVSGCSITALNKIYNLAVKPKYLPAPHFVNSGGSRITSQNVPCYSSSAIISVEEISNAQYYNWVLPAGWSKKDSPGVNMFTTTGPSVEVTPAPGNTNVTVSVKASVGPFNGPSSNLAITRSGSPQILFVGTNPVVYCNSDALVVYEVTALPNFTYTWTYPSGWTCQSGCNTNRITLKPNGSIVSGQAIFAQARTTCSGQTYTSNNVSQAINFSTSVSPDFQVLGPNLLCNTGTYTLQGSTNSNVTWVASNTFININATTGVANRVSDGGVSVNARVNCGSTVQQVSKVIWVGKPGNTFSGSTRVTWGQVVTYEATAQDYATSYFWSFSPNVGLCGTTYGGNCQFGISSNSISIWWEQSGSITLNSTNSCGTGLAKSKTVTLQTGGGPGGGGGCNPCQRVSQKGEVMDSTSFQKENLLEDFIKVYPNPTNSKFSVELDQSLIEKSDVSIKLYDNLGHLVQAISSSESTVPVDASGLQKGIYLLVIQSGNIIEKRRLLID
jgi:hypothetical protein